MNSSSWIPELRELIRLARAYAAGEIHFSYVCCASAALRDSSKLYVANKEIKKFASQWAEMSSRIWPELGRISNPISETEFKQWVCDQIAIFEPLDIAADLQRRGPGTFVK